MSLEQAILDRLEKRNGQIAQLQGTVHALERAADSQREHAMMERGRLLEENKKLTEQITSARLEREQMQHQIAELRTERDRILEASRSLVPKSALKQAVLEAAELHGALNDAQGEIQKLRAEVPLESTREGLKNAVAELNPIKSALKVVYAVCVQYGMADGELLHDFIARIGEALGAERTRAANLSVCRDHWMKIAADCGRMDGEDAGEFMARQALRLAALESKAGPSIETQAEEIARLNAKVAEFEAQGAYSTKVASQLGERIAYVQKHSMALETLVTRIKSYRNTEAVQQCALIHQLIDATLETMGTGLTA